MSAFMLHDEETYYWLGVLYADGNAIEWNRVILKSKEFSFIQAFAEYVGYPVVEGMGQRSKVYRVAFSDKTIRENLLKLGYTKQRKTERPLPKIPKKMERHFLRGYFDGDGSFHKDPRKVTSWNIELSTHPITTEGLKAIIEANCPNANVRTYKKATSERIVIYNADGRAELIKFMYKDALIVPHPKIKEDRVKSLIGAIL